MGAPPAVVIVVRHGARLDASDKQWHLTSPTPYDPPLTYSGWTQSRALGARIASILRSREGDEHGPTTGDGSISDEKSHGNVYRRRHRIVIHTSPFLRCVQTSIAISAGLAQNPGNALQSRPISSHSAKSSPLYSSPRIRPAAASESPRLAPIPEPTSQAKSSGRRDEGQLNVKRATLRVDAFLGEWLSPDYFELITPPPGSVMMVAGAKADLLRREDYSNMIHIRDTQSAGPFQGFPGGWGSPVVAAISDQDEPPLPSMSSLAQALPRRDRTSSLSSAGSSGSRHSGKTLLKTSTTNPAEHGVYQPPIPSYAISNSEPIPQGYVAHARDHCVSVDYQWDSMREPQNWGNGGEYGEEWSSMHKRFRQGLQQLIQFYRTEDDSGTIMAKLGTNDAEKYNSENADLDDDDTDLVVILVTHGAGCNALIGALTNQPVLLDVGLASLTMAVHKPSSKTALSTPGATPDSHSRNSSRTLSISEEYEVKLVANTEHLRSSRNGTPNSSRAPSVAAVPIPRHYGGPSGGGSFVDTDRSRSIGPSGNFGSIRRATSAVATPLSRTYTPARTTSIGLWSAPKPLDAEATQEPGDDMVLNFGDDGARKSASEKSKQSVAVEEQSEEDELPPLGGLWGSPRPTGGADIIREIAPKRRWTVNEPGMA